jgi:hypothetical protein
VTRRVAVVQGIADAGHEHAVRYARQWTETTGAEEERIRELEGLGVLRSVKFALGQRVRQARARTRTSRRTKEQ